MPQMMIKKPMPHNAHDEACALLLPSVISHSNENMHYQMLFAPSTPQSNSLAGRLVVLIRAAQSAEAASIIDRTLVLQFTSLLIASKYIHLCIKF